MFPTAGALPTPVLVEKLASYLEGYNAKIFLGTCGGFCLWFSFSFSRNTTWPVFIEPAISPEIVDRKLDKEICEGRIRGPLIEPPFYNLKVFPLRVIPKNSWVNVT